MAIKMILVTGVDSSQWIDGWIDGWWWWWWLVFVVHGIYIGRKIELNPSKYLPPYLYRKWCKLGFESLFYDSSTALEWLAGCYALTQVIV